jgi:FixJ family two-component response regulator
MTFALKLSDRGLTTETHGIERSERFHGSTSFSRSARQIDSLAMDRCWIEDRGGTAIDRRSTVFIVDDDPLGVEPLRILLKWRLGVDAVVYDRPDLFVAAFDPSRAGCLLLDLAMPEMSGPEVLEHLARRTVLPPTIIITSDGLSSGLARALRAGAIDYLVKPVDPERLVGCVREALDLDRRRRSMSRVASAGR